MVQQSQITVYLQALGAHYLGLHACNANQITVKLIYSGGTINLPYVVAKTSNDGNVAPTFIDGVTSFMPIVTPSPTSTEQAAIHFLYPDAATVSTTTTNFTPPVDTEIAHLDISIPTTLSKPLLIKYPLILNPQRNKYDITVAVPGLYLTPQQVTDATISVLVKMMCGCPVTLGPPASLWPAADFTVQAQVLDIFGNSTQYILSYSTAQNPNSLFSATLPSSQKKISHISFSAIQKSTGNYGAIDIALLQNK